MTLQEQIRANRWRTLLVYVMFALLAAALSAVLGLAFGTGFLVFFGVISIIYGIVSWFAAGSVIAAAAGASKADPKQFPEAAGALETVAIGAGLPVTPPLYIVQDPAPNAFAAGRDAEHAYVAVTTGLLDTMPRRELEAVLAHEVSHIRNRDVRLMTIASVLVGVVALLSDMLMRIAWVSGNRQRGEGQNPLILIFGLVAIVLAPISASLLQLALSRRREFLADASAAELTGDPEGLARALAKLRDDHRPLQRATRATAHLYIESPLRDHAALRSSLGGLFDTHPPLEDRIRALEESGGFRLA